jgi:hypothetical protein
MRTRSRPHRLTAALILALAGCAPDAPQWTRPATPWAQFEADRDDCLARTQRWLPSGERRPDYDALDACMRAKGYVRR